MSPETQETLPQLSPGELAAPPHVGCREWDWERPPRGDWRGSGPRWKRLGSLLLAAPHRRRPRPARNPGCRNRGSGHETFLPQLQVIPGPAC
ncbi:uncharacterized protein ACIQIH_007781 isoform 1-T1 [Cyanocitta cristata]